MKTILITGSSQGLGKSLACVFASNGYNIILHSKDERRLEQLKKNLLVGGSECEIVVGDITVKETIEKLYKAAVKKDLDILINNAGIYTNEPFQDMDIRKFRRIIEVNLIAPTLLIHKIYPIFKRKKTGLIININSIAGKNGSDGEAAYCASKHGLRGFSKSFQFEATRDHVRIIDVYLATMNTGMIEGRREPEKCIQTAEAADLIFRLCEDYPSMRINEIELGRRKY